MLLRNAFDAGDIISTGVPGSDGPGLVIPGRSVDGPACTFWLLPFPIPSYASMRWCRAPSPPSSSHGTAPAGTTGLMCSPRRGLLGWLAGRAHSLSLFLTGSSTIHGANDSSRHCPSESCAAITPGMMVSLDAATRMLSDPTASETKTSRSSDLPSSERP